MTSLSHLKQPLKAHFAELCLLPKKSDNQRGIKPVITKKSESNLEKIILGYGESLGEKLACFALCVCTFGIVPIALLFYKLCSDSSEETAEIISNAGLNDSNNSTALNWIHQLRSSQDAKTIMSLFAEVATQMSAQKQNIINGFVDGLDDGNSPDITLWQSEEASVVARCGAIVFLDGNNTTTLISFGQFLRVISRAEDDNDICTVLFETLSRTRHNISRYKCEILTNLSFSMSRDVWLLGFEGGSIIARRGAILLETDDQLTQLMSCGHYLNTLTDKDKFGGKGSNSSDKGNDLRLLDLSELNLSGVNLSEQCMNRVNLSSANLARANLNNTHMLGTNLANASLTEVKLFGAMFGEGCTGVETNFDGTTITLDLPKDWDKDMLKAHSNRKDSLDSLLSMVKSIPNKYYGLKINLMSQICNSLGNNYIDDQMIRRLMKPIAQSIELLNRFQLKKGVAAELHMLFKMVEGLVGQERKQFMLTNNGFFVQLLAAGIGHENLNINKTAVKLYHEYMNLDEVNQYKKANTLIASKDEFTQENVEENLEDIRTIKKNDCAFVFYNKGYTNNDTNVMIVSQDQIDSMLNQDPNYEWGYVIYIRNGRGRTTEIQTELAYQSFPLFYDNFKSHFNSGLLPKQLELMALDTQHKELLAQTFRFNGSNEKLTDPIHQSKLWDTITPLLNNEKGIDDDHFNAFCETFDLVGQSDTKIAEHLQSSAFTFTLLTSDKFFGRDGDSPAAFRAYANGLMTKAHQLDANLFKQENQDYYPIWKKKLLVPLAGADNCSGVLSTDMVKHARRQGFAPTMNKFRPAAWG
ncbi:MAG: Secreted effector protein [Solimicrobium sp.]|nr:Secreted effector protein [Solimicrobium sp.]